MTIPSKGKGSFAVEPTLSSVSDYCHRENSIGNTIVRRFRHAKERERERVRREKQSCKERDRKRERDREREKEVVATN